MGHDIISGILAINPSAQVSIIAEDFEQIEWLADTPIIPKADIKVAMAELQAEYDSLAYSRARSIAYPLIGDQLDALWKGGDDAAAMKVIIDKVKSDNPKG